MKPIPALFLALLAGCSTTQSRMDGPPLYSRATTVSAAAFDECFVRATGKENVSYLPRANGGSFKSSAGPQDYVFWLVTVADLGNSRQITVQAVNHGIGRNVSAKIEACL